MSRSRTTKKRRQWCACWLCSPRARVMEWRERKADSEVEPYRTALLAAKLDAVRRTEIAERENEKFWRTVAW